MGFCFYYHADLSFAKGLKQVDGYSVLVGHSQGTEGLLHVSERWCYSVKEGGGLITLLS
jgi:hypothetical protein